MNLFILIATILSFLAFIVHAFVGDRELKLIQPSIENNGNHQKQEKWTMARSGWHWISFDLLFAALGLTFINFTNFLQNETQLLQIMAVYFFGYGVAWLVGIAISKRFPMNYLKLGQWILLWVISGLIFLGVN